MDGKYYIDACMEKLGITSKYALWKATDISEARLSDYYKGNRIPDEYACFKFAEILELEPAFVIADIQSCNKKNPDKALFFKSFLTAVGLWIILAVIPLPYSSSFAEGFVAGKRAVTEHKGPLCEMILKFYRAILDIFVRYFTCNWHVKFA